METAARCYSVDASAQLAILIGQLIETYEQHCQQTNNEPLPYLIGTFANRAMEVLQDPAHDMYPKVNKYIMKGAEWRTSRLPAYWLADTVGNQPFYDDTYWREVLWVLEWLVDGLRTLADIDMLRRGGVFEKVMALYSSPAAVRVKGLQGTVLELMYRATCVPGGSDVLITRAGVLSWLRMLDGKDEMIGLMREEVLRTCDQKRVEQWSSVEFGHL